MMDSHGHGDEDWWCQCGRWRGSLKLLRKGFSLKEQHGAHVIEEQVRNGEQLLSLMKGNDTND